MGFNSGFKVLKQLGHEPDTLA